VATTALPAQDRRVGFRRRHGLLIVSGRRPRWSVSLHPRACIVTALLGVATFLVLAWSLTVGDFPLPFGDVVATLVGQGSEDAAFIVERLRLPRALTGVLVGAGFGVSGTIFQRVAGNPLASPDLIGITAGAAASAVFTIVVLGVDGPSVTVGALAGSLLTALTIYVLAHRRGVTGYRLVLVGVGASAVLTSTTHYLLTTAEIWEAHKALGWLAGSLNGRGWEHVRPIGLTMAVLLPLALLLTRQLRSLELGDDTARSLGVRVEPARAALLLVAVGLTAVGTASAGPIGFVALVAPQIAQRLVGGRTVGLLPSAACGALLVVAGDLLGRRVFAPTEIPVGIVTAVLGAPFLLFLLARANRVGSGG
jgi:iron complex transport system permease protein